MAAMYYLAMSFGVTTGPDEPIDEWGFPVREWAKEWYPYPDCSVWTAPSNMFPW
jgi:hypothetical protein